MCRDKVGLLGSHTTTHKKVRSPKKWYNTPFPLSHYISKPEGKKLWWTKNKNKYIYIKINVDTLWRFLWKLHIHSCKCMSFSGELFPHVWWKLWRFAVSGPICLSCHLLAVLRGSDAIFFPEQLLYNLGLLLEPVWGLVNRRREREREREKSFPFRGSSSVFLSFVFPCSITSTTLNKILAIYCLLVWYGSIQLLNPLCLVSSLFLLLLSIFFLPIIGSQVSY